MAIRVKINENLVLRSEILKIFETQRVAAKKLNMSYSRFSGIVRGKQLPNKQELVVLSNALGISPRKLVSIFPNRLVELLDSRSENKMCELGLK